MQSRKKWFLIGSLLILFSILKLSMLWVWQSKQPDFQNQSCRITQTACPFAGGATLQLVGLRDHKTPFAIRATHVPAHVRQITASFSMRDMDMGFNRFELQKQGDGTWLVQGVRLPVCTQTRHDWQIQWQMDGQYFQADFQTTP